MSRHSRAQRRCLRTADLATLGWVHVDQTAGSPASSVAGRLPISQALARLSAEQHRAVRLRFLEGHPRAHVAALMGRTVDAVRVLERQAVARLKADLAAYWRGDLTPAAVSACPA